MPEDHITRAEYDGDKKVYSERFDRDHKRLEALEQNQKVLSDLTASVRVMASEQAALKTDVGEIKEDVKSIMVKPGKRWDALLDKLLFAAAGAFLAWIAAGAPGLS